MPAPRKRAPKTSGDDPTVAPEADEASTTNDVGDLSHRAEQYARGYIGEKPEPTDD